MTQVLALVSIQAESFFKLLLSCSKIVVVIAHVVLAVGAICHCCVCRYMFQYFILIFFAEGLEEHPTGIAPHAPVAAIGPPRSPAWHRHLRGVRSRARKALWKHRLLGGAIPADLRRRLRALQAHHSKPYYKEVMPKNQWKQWDHHQDGHGHKPKGKGGKAPGAQQGQREQMVKGFDGRRIPWPQVSSAPSASSHASSEVESLRDMVKKLASGQQLSQEEMRQLEESPRQKLGHQQRQLNQQRKQLNRERNLEEKIRQNDSDFAHWFDAQKVLMKNEKDRYNGEQQKLKKDLADLRNPPMEEPSDEEEMQPAEEMTRDYALEKRVLQAEQLAYNSQQAFLTLQNQLQVMMSYMAPQIPTDGPTPPIPSAPWTGHRPVPYDGYANGSQAYGTTTQASCQPPAATSTQAATGEPHRCGQVQSEKVPRQSQGQERQGQDGSQGQDRSSHHHRGRRGQPRLALAFPAPPWIAKKPHTSSHARPPDLACEKGSAGQIHDETSNPAAPTRGNGRCYAAPQVVDLPKASAATMSATLTAVPMHGNSGTGACDKGEQTSQAPTIRARSLALEDDGVAMIQRIVDQQPPPQLFTGYQGQYDDHLDDNRIRITGQLGDPVPREGDMTVWRPTVPNYRHLGHPESAHVYLEMIDAGARSDVTYETITRTWPILATTPWIMTLVHDSWLECEYMDRTTDHATITDDTQFPQTTTWRSGILAVEHTYPGTYEKHYEVEAFTTRVPLYYQDLLTQIELTWERHQISIRVNGEELRPEHHGRFFPHGFFIHIRLWPTPSLCSTPSSRSLISELLDRPDSPRPENGESEQESADPETDPPSDHERISRASISSDYTPTARSQSADQDGARLQDDDDDDSCTRGTERGDEVITPEAIPDVSQTHALCDEVTQGRASLTSHVCLEIDACSDVQSPRVEANEIHPGRPQAIPISLASLLGPASNDGGVTSRTRIRLEILIPEHSEGVHSEHTVHTPSVHVPHYDHFAKYTNRWAMNLPRDPPEDCHLHEATQQWLRQASSATQDHKPYLHFFTDGSAIFDEKASWAWILCEGDHLHAQADQLCYVGWLADKVVLDSADPRYIGSHRPDSAAGEASALFWAVLYALSRSSEYSGAAFHYDALTIGNAMDGAASYNPTYRVVEYLRLLTQTLEAVFTPEQILMEHIKGHSGHPLNEMANSLAIFANKDDVILDYLKDFDLKDLFQEEQFPLRWIWLLARKTHDPHAFPHIEDAKMHIPARHTFDSTDPSLPWTMDHGQTAKLCTQDFTPSLKIISFNVRSLKEADQGQDDGYTAGRSPHLEAQLLDCDATVVGLQETRTRFTDVCRSQHFYKFRAAAQNGHGGVELWLRQQHTIGWTGAQTCRFHFDKAVVLHASHNLLLVKIPITTSFAICFGVGHAPHKGYADKDKEDWWRHLCQLLGTHNKSTGTVLLLDANAAVGEILTDGIGNHEASIEDTNGRLLRELATAHDLWLPATFSGCHFGPSATWYSSASKKVSGSRLDYIAIPLDWQGSSISSHTVPNLDVVQSNIDHVAIMLDIVNTMPRMRRTSGTSRPQRIDWQAVRNCRNRAIWDQIFARLPQPSWNTDVHTHWQECHRHLIDRLAEQFPQPKSHPRKPYISEDVWQLRLQKQALRRQATLRGHLCPRLELTSGFYAWKELRCLRQTLFSTTVWQLKCHAAHCRDLRQHRILQRELRLALHLQRLQYLEHIADEANHAPPQLLYAKLRKAGFCSTRRQAARPLPMLQDKDGQMIKDPAELQETWRQYFASIECGRKVKHEELLQLCIYTELESQQCHQEAFLRALPTLHSLERAFRRCKPHRAAGPDLLPPELGRYATRWMAHYLAPLFMKCCLYTTEPVQFKGGILHEIWKRRGPTSKADSYRGILVSSHVGKTFHNVFREPTLTWHADTADALQFGGRQHQGVDFATHTLQSFLQLTATHKRSCGVFFLDIKSAYYRLLRTLAVGPTCSDAELGQILTTMGMPDELLPELRAAALGTSALDETGCPEWLTAFGNQFHRCTWFMTRHTNDVTMTMRGTRPGDGFADLLFNLVVGRILRQLEADLEHEGIQTRLYWNGQIGFNAQEGSEKCTNALSVVWADDIAMMIHHDNPKDLVEVIKAAMTLTIERFAKHGLLLNFDRGETELLLLLRGPGSRQLKRDIFNAEDPSLQIHPHGFGTIQVRLTDRYKHLGSTIHASGGMRQELRIRVGAAHAAFTQHRRSVYHNKALQFSKRLQIFRACVLSVLYWNSGTWPPLCPADMKYFNGAVVRLLRRLLLPEAPHDQLLHWTQGRIYMTAGILEPRVHIRICRLGYFARLMRHGPDALWALLATDQTWYKQIPEDMVWYTDNCQSRTFRPPFRHPTGPEYWHNLLLDKPECRKGLLKKASAHALLQAEIRAKADIFERRLVQELVAISPDMAPQAKWLPPTDTELYVCIPCSRTFPTKVGWAIHTFRAHGRLAAARYLADQTACDCCHHTFLNEHRLYLHLRYSRKCFDQLRARGVCQPPAPGRGSKIWHTQTQYTQCPYLHGMGPDLAPDMPIDQTALAPLEKELLLDLLQLELTDHAPYLQPGTCLAMQESIRLCLCKHPVSLEDMRTVLQWWERLLRTPLRPGQRLIQLDLACWLEALANTLDILSYQWLCPQLLTGAHLASSRADGASQLRAIDAGRCAMQPDPGYGPATLQPIFVHLFSGRRRLGDLQCALESVDWGEAWPPIVISLDVVLDSNHGDLLKQSTQEFWLDLAARGCLDGTLSGPPCESWSVARERWYEEHRGPRPLRSHDHLWGLFALWIKEAKQVLTANGLLQFCLLLHLIQWSKGKFSVLEHPWMPNPDTNATAPSIWKLRATELLCALRGCELEKVYQGLYGARSPKPTGLLCAHLPHPLAAFGTQFQTQHHLPAPLRMGQLQSGEYSTFALKEYPSAFNNLIAQSFKWWLERTDTHLVHKITPEETNILNRFKSVLGQGKAGPDYAT